MKVSPTQSTWIEKIKDQGLHFGNSYETEDIREVSFRVKNFPVYVKIWGNKIKVVQSPVVELH